MDNIKKYEALIVALFRRAWIEIMHELAKETLVNVALFRRAWIEICSYSAWISSFLCRSLQESVNWNLNHQGTLLLLYRRSLQESVNWNPYMPFYMSFFVVALFRRAWIEIINASLNACAFASRSLQESVNWNIIMSLEWEIIFPSLSSGERELKLLSISFYFLL